MIPRPGIRLVYDVTVGDAAAIGGESSPGEANPDDAGDNAATGERQPSAGTASIPAELTLVLQPSRSARADISIHAPNAEGYLIMEETDTLWRAALTTGDHPLTRALAELAYPRFLPGPDQPFRSMDPPDEFLVSATEERAWDLVYDSGATVGIRNLVIEPMALDGGGPSSIAIPLASGEQARLTLRSAAVYRQREISGAVVSAFGRPLSGITVAPHPQVGRLAPSRVAVTDAGGAFTLPYRVAPGDSVRLFYGRTAGSGEEARIATPQEIRGRVASPDFATLIFTEQ